MQIGMVGLGRMGGNMARRLARGGIEVVAFDRSAEARGARVVDGLGMLLHQGAAAFVQWTGSEPPVEVMRAALRG